MLTLIISEPLRNDAIDHRPQFQLCQIAVQTHMSLMKRQSMLSRYVHLDPRESATVLTSIEC